MNATAERVYNNVRHSDEGFVHMLAQDLAMVQEARQDNPELGIPSIKKLAHEVLGIVSQEERPAIEAAAEGNVTLGDLPSPLGAMVDAERPRALHQLIEDGIDIRQKAADTGEIKITPAKEYIAAHYPEVLDDIEKKAEEAAANSATQRGTRVESAADTDTSPPLGRFRRFVGRLALR